MFLIWVYNVSSPRHANHAWEAKGVQPETELRDIISYYSISSSVTEAKLRCYTLFTQFPSIPHPAELATSYFLESVLSAPKMKRVKRKILSV